MFDTKGKVISGISAGGDCTTIYSSILGLGGGAPPGGQSGPGGQTAPGGQGMVNVSAAGADIFSVVGFHAAPLAAQ